MRLVLHPEASAEVAAATLSYEERHPGLGREFLDELDRAFTAVLESPHRWPSWPGVPVSFGVRRFLLARFPYALAHGATDNRQIVVLAVAHLRRRPGYWRARKP